jgi:signal transduction histidine kinase
VVRSRPPLEPELPNYRALITLLALLLAPLLAGAQAPLRLATDARVLAAAGHLERLDDPTGMLDAAQVAQASGWIALPGHLNAGYTDAAVWLRLRLQAPEPAQWMLLIGNAVVDDVRAYIQAPGNGGVWRPLGASGEEVPRHQWPVDYRSPALQLELAQAGDYTVLVRLATRNALKTRIDVWQRLAFDNHTRREGLFFGLYFGFYLLLICLHALFWRTTRAPMSGLFLAYIGACVLNEVLSLGLVQQITGLPAAWSDRMLGIGIASALPIAVRMGCAQLLLARELPGTARTLILGSTSIGAAGALLIALGHYGAGIMPVQILTLPFVAIFIGLALWLLRSGHRPARFFLVVFGTFYASVLVAFLRNLGLLPVNAFTEHISALGTMVHMVLLSLWIVGRYERQRRKRERQQVYLEADLAQRQLREDELLRSLELERRVRQEQRDFVAMVSHEFRTPLAVITTSAQQLARNLAAPPAKTLERSHNIRAAAQRLLALVDDCLADDRMGEPDAAPQHAPCDLHALIGELCQDFPSGRIACAHDEGTRHVTTDAALLRIALRNLLANADRHAPEDAVVQVQAQHDGERLRIEVSNPADAIAPEEQSRLFERYWRGRGAQHQPGAGLGLYLVRRIAEKLGGQIELVAAGGDTPVRLRFELPLQVSKP